LEKAEVETTIRHSPDLPFMPSPAHDDAVPAPGVAIKLSQAFDTRCSQGIEMDVANQLPEIEVFLTHDGFVAVLVF
jgi:hypothetical protein